MGGDAAYSETREHGEAALHPGMKEGVCRETCDLYVGWSLVDSDVPALAFSCATHTLCHRHWLMLAGGGTG